MGIRIRYFTDAAGEERVRISGANGEPMFTSEGYKKAASAAHAVQVMSRAFQDGDVVIDEGPAIDEPLEDDESGDEQHVVASDDAQGEGEAEVASTDA
jgi:uncharacterized protein YegP (UPF0339 family)